MLRAPVIDMYAALRTASDIAALARGLRRLDGESPDEIRARVLETLSACAPEYPVHLFSLARVAGELAMTTHRAAGPVAEAAGRTLATRPAYYLDDESLLGTRHLVDGGFAPLSSIYARETLRSMPLWREVFSPHGVVDELRLLVHADARFVAWLGLLRPRGAPRFGEEACDALAPLVEPISEALTRAESAVRACCPHEAGDILMRADGTIDMASSAGRAWLAVPGLLEAIRRRVAELDEARPGPDARMPRLVVALSAAEVQIVCMEDESPVRYLVHVCRNRPLELTPGAALTEQQRHIAEAAADGATNAEIAERLGISINTVKYHLKSIFETLSISRRSELRDLLDETR